MKIGVLAFALLNVYSLSHAETLTLDNGYFYGPGLAVYNDTGFEGVHRFVDAEVRNLTFTGPFSGYIPFFNNGVDEPNVIAEKLHGIGIVDGRASDGTLINENADTALRLNFRNESNGESADMMVVAEFNSSRVDGGEPVFPDQAGNLNFETSILADPGSPDQIVRFTVRFTTGSVTVPKSKRTVSGLHDGIDRAGPFKAGSILIGRIGDYNGDGFMDGRLVLAESTPMDLVVARGNPIAQIRPWFSDIPIAPAAAAGLTLQNILANYPNALKSLSRRKDLNGIVRLLGDMEDGLEASLGNMAIALKQKPLPQSQKNMLKDALVILRRMRTSVIEATYEIESHRGSNNHHNDSIARLDEVFVGIGELLTMMLPSQ